MIRTPFCGGPGCEWAAQPVGIAPHYDERLMYVAFRLWLGEALRAAPAVSKQRTYEAWCEHVTVSGGQPFLSQAEHAIAATDDWRAAHTPPPPPEPWVDRNGGALSPYDEGNRR